MSLLSPVRAAVLDRVRRHGRPVLWSPEWMGFGNLLYGYELLPSVGQGARALATPNAERWRQVMPRLNDLLVDRANVRWNDRRVVDWYAHRELGPLTERPVGHSWAVRHTFISEYVIGEGPFRQLLEERSRPDARDLVLNIRRGDYYASDENRELFGMDTVAYVRAALALSEETGGPVRSIHVVSDDIPWVRRELGWLGSDYALTFPAAQDGPIENFADVAGARRMVIMNSTFSYWAGYVSKVRHPESEHLVVAPRFFARGENGGRSWNLEPGWTIVEGIPPTPPRPDGA